MNTLKFSQIDPEIAEIAQRYEDMINQQGLDLEGFRNTYREIITQQGKPSAPVETREFHVPTRHGPVLTRVYSPSPDDTRPLIIYMHGGGFMVGDLDCVDIALHRISREADVTILSIEYALAPEHRYPIAFEQCQDVLTWSSENRNTLQVNDKIGVAGDSAGGNLAALLAIWARDTAKISISWQGLVNPVLDFPGIESDDKESLVIYANGPILNTGIMKYFNSQYFNSNSEKIEASPLLHSDHSSLPVAFIAVGELDPLRDDSIAYGLKLASAGTSSTVKVYEGMVHNFITMTHLSKRAFQLIDDLVASACASLYN